MLEEHEDESTEEVRKLFNRYVSALAGDTESIDEEDDPIETLSDEDFDSLPCSTTKH